MAAVFASISGAHHLGSDGSRPTKISIAIVNILEFHFLQIFGKRSIGIDTSQSDGSEGIVALQIPICPSCVVDLDYGIQDLAVLDGIDYEQRKVIVERIGIVARMDEHIANVTVEERLLSAITVAPIVV